MMADFQNALISRIFSVFWSGFLHRTTVNDLYKDFGMFFAILIFDSRSGSFKAYSPCMMAHFQNGLTSPIFSVFWSGFLHRTTVNDL